MPLTGVVKDALNQLGIKYSEALHAFSTKPVVVRVSGESVIGSLTPGLTPVQSSEPFETYALTYSIRTRGILLSLMGLKEGVRLLGGRIRKNHSVIEVNYTLNNGGGSILIDFSRLEEYAKPATALWLTTGAGFRIMRSGGESFIALRRFPGIVKHGDASDAAGGLTLLLLAASLDPGFAEYLEDALTLIGVNDSEPFRKSSLMNLRMIIRDVLRFLEDNVTVDEGV
ncbi:hypothetical protein [Caldivirga sp.]|uniref:hypothetical protein n=1 Tax=Caldivirga sp. TaxID=2080243 RepID=UPI003D14FC57